MDRRRPREAGRLVHGKEEVQGCSAKNPVLKKNMLENICYVVIVMIRMYKYSI